VIVSCVTSLLEGRSNLAENKIPPIADVSLYGLYRLELAVKNYVDDVNVVSHFKMFVDEWYKV